MVALPLTHIRPHPILPEAASQVLSSPTEVSEESQAFATTISQTLQGLSQGSEALQVPFSETDIMSMFSGVPGAAGADDQNAFLPFMQGMMQSLLSKEVLYPSLKDILEKYPQWLEENREKIGAEELERYRKQQELMERVCEQLEKETDADTAEKKREQFEKVLTLMQKVSGAFGKAFWLRFALEVVGVKQWTLCVLLSA